MSRRSYHSIYEIRITQTLYGLRYILKAFFKAGSIHILLLSDVGGTNFQLK